MSRARAWCFTINNPKDKPSLEGKCKYAVFQLEQGENGTAHYQGYIEFKTMKSLKQVKQIVGVRSHVEIRKGTRQQARDYCMKEEGQLEPPEEVGQWTTQGDRTDLAKTAVMIEEKGLNAAIDKYPTTYMKYRGGMQAYARHCQERRMKKKPFRKPRIVVFYGESGAGKTKFAHQLDKHLYCLPEPKDRVWFDGYLGEETILIDEFYGQITLHKLLKMFDGYKQREEVKGGTVMRQNKNWIVTSNKHPQDWYKNTLCTCALWRRLTEYGCVIELNKDLDPREESSLICNVHNKVYKF